MRGLRGGEMKVGQQIAWRLLPLTVIALAAQLPLFVVHVISAITICQHGAPHASPTTLGTQQMGRETFESEQHSELDYSNLDLIFAAAQYLVKTCCTAELRDFYLKVENVFVDIRKIAPAFEKRQATQHDDKLAIQDAFVNADNIKMFPVIFTEQGRGEGLPEELRFSAFLDLHSGSCILCMAWLSLQPVTSAFLHFGLVTFVLFLHGLQVDAGLTGDSTSSVQNSSCSGSFDCKEGVILPIWYPENPSLGDKIARVIVYFVALIYMFLGVSIIADRFMASIEVITSQEKEITIKKPNGETTTTTIRIWNETVSNLTLMALGSSAPEILLSLIEVCGHGFIAGDLGPSTIVGSAAFNMFIIIAICVYVIPDGETRKIKHLRVFFVTAAWSIFAYIWLYMILAVFSPGVVQVWEGLLTLFFFPLCVLLAWIADRRLLFYKYMHKKYRTDKHRGIIIESEGDHPKGIEMDGKMMNSHFLDGNLVTVEGKEVDESRKEMIRILKDLKQKHPEKDLDQLVEMANYYALSHQQKSRAFYRIQATRMMTGAGNILKKHAAEQAKKSTSLHEVRPDEPEEFISKIYFDPCSYQCLENCGAVLLTVVRKGGDMSKTIYVDYKTEDGSANAGADYEFTEGTVVLKSGETQKEFSVGIIDDDIFEEDEHFFVRLSNLRVVESEEPPELSNSPYPKAILASPCVATVTILDDDHAGIFTFECDVIHVSESIGVMEVKVLRTSGARGTVIVPFRTVEGTAKGGGEDFEDTYGELEFKNDETVKTVHIKVIDDEEYEKNKNFFIELMSPRMVDMSLQKGSQPRVPADLLLIVRVAEAIDLPAKMQRVPQGGPWKTVRVKIVDEEEYERQENFFIALGEPKWMERGISAQQLPSGHLSSHARLCRMLGTDTACISMTMSSSIPGFAKCKPKEDS
ncbi:sodium calcium exchanger 3 isoform x1 [Limosa lapponica baueri]|uniref:Sodium calcium exchanger 3 isoform x1 n=1 Tax=Limosa lapponica baueri TaxID=1758121 RepID=A0A2I0TZ59_LIMLA|nr:sodium calcium exchanger 3 isoform x1 [Limosa lapponica baueri]